VPWNTSINGYTVPLPFLPFWSNHVCDYWHTWFHYASDIHFTVALWFIYDMWRHCSVMTSVGARLSRRGWRKPRRCSITYPVSLLSRT